MSVDVKSSLREYGFVSARIMPENSKEEFLREAILDFAREDAPIDVFSKEFGEVEMTEQQVYICSINMDVDYQAGVGYDRQEPYLDVETYYEKEPYTDYEVYYENGHRYQRPVTKYRKVEKQRQVTKYRTVTDWSTTAGSRNVKTTKYATNGYNMDGKSFIKSFTSMDSSAEVVLEGEEAEGIALEQYALDTVCDSIRNAAIDSIAYSLSCDHSRDINYVTTGINEIDANIYVIPQYTVSVEYGGETYEKRDYAFGDAAVAGDSIENTESLESAKEKIRAEAAKKRKAVEDAVPKKEKTGMAGMGMLTLLVLAASILISIFIRSRVLVLGGLAAALVFFILGRKKAKSVKKKVEKETDDLISEINRDMRDKVDNYSAHYRAKVLEEVNAKLTALGLDETDAEELFGEDEDDEY
ncbi:MAG: hypothetical protein IJ426_01305 [Clostridia bacterium]|nr:hypothetical protein [Clostridia bacterium]